MAEREAAEAEKKGEKSLNVVVEQTEVKEGEVAAIFRPDTFLFFLSFLVIIQSIIPVLSSFSLLYSSCLVLHSFCHLPFLTLPFILPSFF